MTTQVGVIVPAFNRPNLLRQALASIAGAAEVVLLDDGSTAYDPLDLASWARKELRLPLETVIRNPPLNVEQRLVVPRQGKLLNRALAALSAPYVAYLCDDDLFAPGWLYAVDVWFNEHPEHHLVRGDWYRFEHGQMLENAVKDDRMDYRQMTAGNFAHRRLCFAEEGIRWSEESVAVHDDFFLRTFDETRVQYPAHHIGNTPHIGVLAGYRREHAFNALAFTEWPGRYGEAAREYLAGPMEPAC